MKMSRLLLSLAALLLVLPALLARPTGRQQRNVTLPFDLHVIEHASFYVTIPQFLGGDLIVFNDPYDTGLGLYDGLPKADLVLLSHAHADHFDLNCLKKVAVLGTTAFVAPPDVTESLVAAGYPRGLITTLANWDSAVLYPGISIEAIPAYNMPPGTHHPQGLWNGYVLTINGTRVYISGDSEDIPEMRALKDIDLAFVAFNLPYTMDVPDAADAVLDFLPAVVYPYHYRESNVDLFRSLVEAGTDQVEVRQLNWYPGGTF